MSYLKPEAPIGIFDSGLGGLAVMREVVKLLPNENILFFGDTQRQPYGPRTMAEVRQFSVEITGYLIEHGAKMVLIGCNTASVAGGEAAQQGFPETPVIGMISPGVRAALQSSRTKRLGVWGTEITVASKAYDQMIYQQQADARVVGVACPTLLRLAEKGRIEDKPYLRKLATQDLQPVLDMQADTLILGCTDFTCVRDVIDEVVAGRMTVVDPAEEVAREAKRILIAENALCLAGSPPRHEYVITGDDIDNFSTFGAQFMGVPAINVARIPLAEVQQGARLAKI